MDINFINAKINSLKNTICMLESLNLSVKRDIKKFKCLFKDDCDILVGIDKLCNIEAKMCMATKIKNLVEYYLVVIKKIKCIFFELDLLLKCAANEDAVKLDIKYQSFIKQIDTLAKSSKYECYNLLDGSISVLKVENCDITKLICGYNFTCKGIYLENTNLLDKTKANFIKAITDHVILNVNKMCAELEVCKEEIDNLIDHYNMDINFIKTRMEEFKLKKIRIYSNELDDYKRRIMYNPNCL